MGTSFLFHHLPSNCINTRLHYDHLFCRQKDTCFILDVLSCTCVKRKYVLVMHERGMKIWSIAPVHLLKHTSTERILIEFFSYIVIPNFSALSRYQAAGGQTGGQRQQSGEGSTGLGGQVGSGGQLTAELVQAGWFRIWKCWGIIGPWGYRGKITFWNEKVSK